MPIYKTYFNESNTLVKGFTTGSTESKMNTALNPITELFYGAGSGSTVNQTKYARHIFNFNLDSLQTKINSKEITLSGFSGTVGLQHQATHKLKMTNTIINNASLLGKKTLFNDSTRAHSFDLVTFKLGQTWDAGISYNSSGVSNWCYRKTGYYWSGGTYDTPLSTCGIYEGDSALTSSNYSRYAMFPYTAMTNTTATTMVATQHFSRGNEDMDMDITDVINDMLTGTSLTTDSVQGYVNDQYLTGIKNFGMGVAFNTHFEKIKTDEKRYVGFFSENTGTIFEPYIETTYTNSVVDDRDRFFMDKTNRVCLYVSAGGKPTNLDELPHATIYDQDGDIYQQFLSVNTDHENASLYTPSTSIQHINTGIYCVDLSVPNSCACEMTEYSDYWSGLTINGMSMKARTQYITIRNEEEYYLIGTGIDTPKSYGFSIEGIKVDETIKRGDQRKVIVSARVPYTINVSDVIDTLQYRLYVKDGVSEHTIIDYTDVNRTPAQNYFIIDTSWLIPNTYYIDLKLTSNQKVETYDQQLRFIVTNQGLPDNLVKRR